MATRGRCESGARGRGARSCREEAGRDGEASRTKLVPAGRWDQCLTRDLVGTVFTEQSADSTERASPEEIDEVGMEDSIGKLCLNASISQTQRKRQRSKYIPNRAFEKTASTRSTSGTRLSTVDNGEVKKAAVRTQEAFLEFEQCL